MNTLPSRVSLSELRLRTDRELVILAGREIERALALEARGAIADAEAALRRAKLFLRLAGAMAALDPHRPEMEARLKSARAALDRRPIPAASATCRAAC